ncbi:MGMT family protein [Geothermobacter hydrogeniphilus]|uniref:Cysteine methyltransferase n=1 Tax=Geothermobacter hydrogeniphilus TaxID=1969733 RepID=A0A1X0XT42_9BACT|nr:MGMT family protein [Geothermobacter hydrogeniphilus]ORJ56066.1 cysteine methyltransferase [Geothermobacter hydrogeniphilus]
MSASPSLYQRIYDRVRQIPEGRVTTYGRIARLVGCGARTVGFAMAALPTGHELPWQRVINSKGEVSPRAAGDGGEIQRLLLEAEGIFFDARGRVDLARFGWDGSEDGK